jgi:two-component system, LytTR family, sensor kinase
VSTQLDLAVLDRSRRRAMEAELRALRAQISPHFVYNSLAAIASFVRTDPERARELLLEFADFTRYAFRRGGEFTRPADELRNVERYLTLEQARFGDRLQIELVVAPEVLPVTLQARDDGSEALIIVEDDGVGSDPDLVRRVLAGESDTDSVGLVNVDARMRQVFGDGCGLVVETPRERGRR